MKNNSVFPTRNQLEQKKNSIERINYKKKKKKKTKKETPKIHTQKRKKEDQK